MALGIHALCFDALDPPSLAEFWSGVLGWELVDDPQDGVVVLPDDDTGIRIRFVPTQAPKPGPNQMHFDLTSGSLADQQHTVARALALGGRHIDVGQLPEEDHVVLADPEGNEFCVIEPGNRFLADCGFIGALSSDGLQEVGYFWSKALDWPLVWDQDEETAIQAPYGGPKITWGGPPVAPKVGRNRLRFDLVPSPDTDLEQEVDRLLALGATRIDRDLLADPGGNEFRVVSGAGGRAGWAAV
jgi:predicted enzyme related to lactoylglutathione lyase